MMDSSLQLDGRSLTVGDVVRVARTPGARLRIDPAARAALVASRDLVDRAIAGGGTIYGINTGFGKLANVRIAPDQL
ncbi:MAG: aromatic amino acid lyase, partial [Gemmatimonadota bacterium]